jgi:hypothetical protein
VVNKLLKILESFKTFKKLIVHHLSLFIFHSYCNDDNNASVKQNKKMKRIAIIVCTCMVFIAACRKANTTTGNISLAGTWELRQTSAMGGLKNYAPGNGNLIKFTDSTYKFYSNNTLVKSGIYTTTADDSAAETLCLQLPENEYTNRIIYDNASDSTKVFFDLDNNVLKMISGCFAYDAGSSQQYERINTNN